MGWRRRGDPAHRALALELGPAITVNAVAPEIAEAARTSAIDPTFVDRAIAHTPAGRLVTRQEVANLIAWLCSPAANLITGHTSVDGGWRSADFERTISIQAT
jgi:NAD(P)-dependent dehydrogenase (short-subunit alcohol dehydrogenase family)